MNYSDYIIRVLINPENEEGPISAGKKEIKTPDSKSKKGTETTVFTPPSPTPPSRTPPSPIQVVPPPSSSVYLYVGGGVVLLIIIIIVVIIVMKK